MLWTFCDGNGRKNWDLPECTPPCEMPDNQRKDKRCQPDAQRRRR
jgi:hypothetical protein